MKNKERKEKEMNMEQLIVFLLIGGVAGWLAGQIMKGGGLSIIGNIVVGVIGAVLGVWIFGFWVFQLGENGWVHS